MSEQKFVNESEIDRENGIVMDYGQDEEIKVENLPDSNIIMDNIILILEHMNTPEMVELRKNNNDVFISTMETKFEDFAERYYSVFRMVISGKDISMLFEMLSTIDKMKKNKTSVEKGEQHIGNKLKQFLPDGFEEKLQKETVQKMNSKSKNKKNKNKK